MKEFLIKYWLEVLFGLITTGFGVWANHYKKLLKESQKQKKNEFWEEIKAKITEDHNALEKEMKQNNLEMEQRFKEQNAILRSDMNAKDEALTQQIQDICDAVKTTNEQINTIRTGMLSVQGRSFKNDCRMLLDTNHVITLTEFEQISADHSAYNLLGGNHEGDMLYNMVETKYSMSLK